MAKYIGSKCRQCRREGGKLFLKGEKCFTAKCAVENRPFPPGQHGQRRQRLSDYATQLREKQKLRRIYGILERQFRNYYKEAAAYQRLDRRNPAAAAGRSARQRGLPHGFSCFAQRSAPAGSSQRRQRERRRVNIPSYQVPPNDVISVNDKSRDQLRIQSAVDLAQQRGISDWIEVDAKKMQGVYKSRPERSELPADINEHLVVELYSK